MSAGRILRFWCVTGGAAASPPRPWPRWPLARAGNVKAAVATSARARNRVRRVIRSSRQEVDLVKLVEIIATVGPSATVQTTREFRYNPGHTMAKEQVGKL